MLKRLFLLLCIVMAVGDLSAQQGSRLRPRVHRYPRANETSTPPLLSITLPTDQPTFNTTAASVDFGGIATDANGVTSVTWSCATCTPTSGTASGPDASGLWTVTGASSPTTVLDDTFSEAANTNITSHTAAPTGGGMWSTLISDPMGNFWQVRSVGYVRPGLITNVMAVQATPSAALSGNNYDIEATIYQIGSSSDLHGFYFGGVDSNNFCAVMFYGPLKTTDLYLGEKVSGSWADTGSTDINPAATHTVKLVKRGNSHTVQYDGVDAIGPITSTHCSGGTNVGLICGPVRGGATDRCATGTGFDRLIVVDQGSSSGVTLSSGNNDVTFTATNVNTQTTVRTIRIVKGASDTTPPVLSFLSPPCCSFTQTTGASITVSGDATDNVGVDYVSCAYDGNATTVTGVVPGTSVTWSTTFTLTSGGTRNLICTAHDAAANTHSQTLAISYDATDITNPTISIDLPTSAATYTATATGFTVSGSAGDTGGSGLASVLVSCDVCSVGATAGTGGWSASITGLTAGVTNNVTVTATDGAGNTATDTLAITYLPPVTIVTTTLPPAQQNSAYSQTLAASGGTLPLTWDNNSGGSSLGGGACTGFSISSAGVVSGTPTTTGTCNFTAKVTDSAGSPQTDTQALSIVVSASVALGGTNHADFNSRCALAATEICASLRSLTQFAPHPTGYLNKGSDAAEDIDYDPDNSNGDATPQDAIRVAFPAWGIGAGMTLQSDIDSTTEHIFISGSTGGVVNAVGIKIDNEIMACAPPIGGTTCVITPASGSNVGELTVIRGLYGTTAASHTAGATVLRSGNATRAQFWIPFVHDGRTTENLLAIWDMYWPAAWLNLVKAPVDLVCGHEIQSPKELDCKKAQPVPWAGGKGVRLNTCNNIGGGDCGWWTEIMYHYGGPTGDSGGQTFNVSTDTMALGLRDGAPLTPGIKVSAESPRPQDDHFIVKANTWTRFFLHMTYKDELTLTDNLTTLNTALTDTTGTSVVFDTPTSIWNPSSEPGTATNVISDTLVTGRAMKIDSEIMKIQSCTPGAVTTNNITTCTVQRGQYGTAAATHSAGATIFVTWQRLKLCVADETRDPVCIWDALGIAGHHHNNAPDGIQAVYFSLSTSTSSIVYRRYEEGFADLPLYIRDFTGLRNPPSDWLTTIATKPTVGGN